MKIAVLQPSYLPWLGYLDQIADVDAFVFYDDVQFDKNGWRNRNRIRVPNEQGWAWLTIPVTSAHAFPRLDELQIDSRVPWQRKHLAAISAAYGRAAHFSLFEQYFGTFYREERFECLVDAAIASVRRLLSAAEIGTPVYRSSELGIAGDRNTRLLNLCRFFHADTYVSGLAAQAYLDEALFARAGIAVEWQAYRHPEYSQRFAPFISHLSALDALLTTGRTHLPTKRTPLHV